MIDQTKLAHLIDRTIGSKGQKLKKQNEYMYWSPFVSHHKPKLQINIITGNGIVGFPTWVVIICFSYLKK